MGRASVELAFEQVVCGYGDAMVVRGVSGRVAPGRVLGILGRNGVGKTTLLRALAGTLPLASGRVTWCGRDLSTVAPHRRLATGIAHVPQENVVFGELSVADNLWLHLDCEPGRQKLVGCNARESTFQLDGFYRPDS